VPLLPPTPATAPPTSRARRAGPCLTHRLGGLLLTLLLGLVLAPPAAAGPVPAPSVPTPAQPTTSELQVVLDQVTPSTVTPDRAVTITGTIRNDGTGAVPVDSVRASTTYRGLDTRSLVSAWADGTSGVTTTRELGEDEVAAALVPGAAVRFRIAVEAGTIAPPFDFATLPLLLSVSRTGDGSTVGELRTFLPWDGQTDYDHHPLATAVLVPLTLPPDPDLLSAQDDTRAVAWEDLAGPRSDLVELVGDLADDPVTFLADPALLATPEPPPTLAPPAEEPGQGPVEPTATPSPTPTDATESPGDGSRDDGTTDDVDTDTGDRTGAPAADGEEDGSGDGGSATEQPTTGGPATGPADPDEEAPEGRPGPSDQAAALRTALRSVDESRLWWLPYGDPDVAALQELGAAEDELPRLLRGSATTDAALSTAGPSAPVDGTGTDAALARGGRGIAWPLWDSATDEQVSALREQWTGAGGDLTAIVLPSSSLGGSGALTVSGAARHTTGVTLLGYDERLSGLVASAGPAEQQGAALQRLLAETLAVYQEQPATDRELLLALPRGHETDPVVLSDLLRTLAEAPWLRATGVDELLTSAATTEPVALVAPADQAVGSGGSGSATAGPGPAAYPVPGPTALTEARLAALTRLREDLSGAGQIVPEGGVRAAAWLAVLDQSLSARWREDPVGWTDPVDAARGVADEVLTGVRVNPTTINFLADEGLIQLTVTNSLPVQVSDVRVTLTPGHPRLRVVEQPEPVTVGPGSRATVQFRARALSAGEVEVRTTMAAPDGTPIGRAEVMQVRVQPTGAWIYWVLGTVAGIILVLGLWRALRPRPTGTASPTKPPLSQEST
jgi:hypothetical protein